MGETLIGVQAERAIKRNHDNLRNAVAPIEQGDASDPIALRQDSAPSRAWSCQRCAYKPASKGNCCMVLHGKREMIARSK